MKELIDIQRDLKAPKNQRNNFGKYDYRSCEDILEAVKPLCARCGGLLTLSDKMIAVGDRVYVQTTATFTAGVKSVSVTAYAREPMTQKGMSESQLTGTASSYARKYALNGLFLIDDTKDADTQDNRRANHKATPEQIVTLENYAGAENDAEKAKWINQRIKAGLTEEEALTIIEKIRVSHGK